MVSRYATMRRFLSKLKGLYRVESSYFMVKAFKKFPYHQNVGRKVARICPRLLLCVAYYHITCSFETIAGDNATVANVANAHGLLIHDLNEQLLQHCSLRKQLQLLFLTPRHEESCPFAPTHLFHRSAVAAASNRARAAASRSILDDVGRELVSPPKDGDSVTIGIAGIGEAGGGALQPTLEAALVVCMFADIPATQNDTPKIMSLNHQGLVEGIRRSDGTR